MKDQLAGGILRARDAAPRLRLTADVVVVGSGPGGAMVLREAARLGLRAVALEAGAPEQSAGTGLLGRRSGRPIANATTFLLQGSGLGGSGKLSANICRAPTDDLLDRWRREADLNFSDFKVDLAESARLLGSHVPEAEALDDASRLLLDAFRARGFAAGALPIAQAMERAEGTHPAHAEALEAGALIVCDARVDRLVRERGVIRAVQGHLIDPGRGAPIGEFEVQARAVVLAASAIGSAQLASACRVPDASRRLGRSLHLAPSVPVFGVMNSLPSARQTRPVAVECTEGLAPSSAEGPSPFWIAPSLLPCALRAALLPGVGDAHAATMDETARSLCLLVTAADAARGAIHSDAEAERIRWAPEEADREALLAGIRVAAETLLAAGAREVLIPLDPLVRIRAGEDPATKIRSEDFGPWSPRMLALHPSSTLPMHGDPRQGVTDASGRFHGMENLFAADLSVLPTATALPPLLLITAIGRRIGRRVANQLL